MVIDYLDCKVLFMGNLDELNTKGGFSIRMVEK